MNTNIEIYNHTEISTEINKYLLSVSHLYIETRLAISYYLSWFKEFVNNVLPILAAVEIANIAIRVLRSFNLSYDLQQEVIRWLRDVLQNM